MANNEDAKRLPVMRSTCDDDNAYVVPHPRTSDIRGYGQGIDTDQAEADEYRNG